MTIVTDKFYVFNHNITNLRINDDVKVTSPKNENFWINIIDIDGERIIGVVMNNLLRKHKYNKDDIIECQIKHIRAVYKNN